MPGVNSILEMAKQALHTQQLALNIVGHNIANANRTDYSRQRVNLKASTPIRYPEGYWGTGVEIEGIQRQRDRFVDAQLRKEYSVQGDWSYREQILSQVESVFNEPSDSSMNAIMATFWDGCQELINNPESAAARATLRQRAVHLTSQFNYLHNNLATLQSNLDREISQEVSDINNLAKKIAMLNERIGSQENAANDLLDQRDKYLDELSKIIDIDYHQNPNNTISVLINGRAIVESTTLKPLTTETQMVNEQPMQFPAWADTKQSVEIKSGKVKGLIELRSQVIPDYMNRLDNLALALAKQVNQVHESGYGLKGSTSIPFFSVTTTGAGDIAVSDEILNDLDLIAAGKHPIPGNTDNIFEIYGLRDELLMNENSATFEEYYNTLISELGTVSQEALFANETSELIVTQVENQRQSIMGVSIDEEMISLIKIQTAYQAASKIVTMTNDLMDHIMGMV